MKIVIYNENGVPDVDFFFFLTLMSVADDIE